MYEYNRRPVGRLELARLRSLVELEECSLEIILCSVEEVLTKEFTSLLKIGSSKFKAFTYHIILVPRVASVLVCGEWRN